MRLQDLADENGLSPDSLRGSEHHIRLDLIGSPTEGTGVRYDASTGKPLTRDTLSRNELHALHVRGVLVDENGERLPELERASPISATATVGEASQLAPDSQRMTREQFLASYSQEETLTPAQWRDKLAAESNLGGANPEDLIPKQSPEWPGEISTTRFHDYPSAETSPVDVPKTPTYPGDKPADVKPYTGPEPHTNETPKTPQDTTTEVRPPFTGASDVD